MKWMDYFFTTIFEAATGEVGGSGNVERAPDKRLLSNLFFCKLIATIVSVFLNDGFLVGSP
jgi:hypothetical protein